MKTLSLLFCTAVACILMPGTDANAQTYSLGNPVGPGCGADSGYVGSSCGVDGGYVGSGCGVDGGGNFGSACGINAGCGVNGGCNMSGCGTNGAGCGMGGRCGPGLGLGLRRPGRGPGLRPNGRLRGLLGGGNHLRYFTADFGWAVMDSMAEVIDGSGAPLNIPRFELEDNVVGRIGIGKYIGPWRLESEVGYREFHINDKVGTGFQSWDGSGRRETTTMMLNIFRDFNCGGRIRPYAKGGVGASYNKNSGSIRNNNVIVLPGAPGNVTTFPEDDSYELAWSVGGGLGICLTERLIMDLEYQYIDLGASRTGNNQMGNALGMGDGFGHEFTLGFRVNY